MNYNRIKDSVNTELLRDTHIVIVGAGGAKQLILNLARTGVERLTVLDIDCVDDTNIVRQGYNQDDIGKNKVDALKSKIYSINPNLNYKGITRDFLTMTRNQLDKIFKDADLFLFLTDNFKAQAFGNRLAIRYKKPALWAGWYAKSRTAEIFFLVPRYTPSCFRCAVSSRYLAQAEQTVEISSSCNTIFHSALLDSYIGLLTLAILHHSDKSDKEMGALFQSLLNEKGHIERNFLQLKIHPKGGNPLFDKLYAPLGAYAHNFTIVWQKIEPELKPKYEYDCPDCKGSFLKLVDEKYK